MNMRSITLRSILREVSAISREAMTISKQLYQSRPASVLQLRQLVQQMAVEDAPNNTLSLYLLKLDKELVYLKYHGMNKYVLSKVASFGSKERKLDKKHQIPLTSIDNDKTRARIAFMITREQKNTLSSTLRYPPDIIKKLKPFEANLILDNCIPYDENGNAWKVSLDDLVKHNEDLLKKERMEAEEQIRNMQISELGMGFSNPAQQEYSEESFHRSEKEKSLSMSSTIESSKSSLDRSQATDKKFEMEVNENDILPHTWYAVLQHFPDTKSAQTIALYKTEKEAQECIRFKNDLYSRDNMKSTMNHADEKSIYSLKKVQKY